MRLMLWQCLLFSSALASRKAVCMEDDESSEDSDSDGWGEDEDGGGGGGGGSPVSIRGNFK